MNGDASPRIRSALDGIYREESRRIFATLIRLLGDFELAEEALQDAFVAALERWDREGIPSKPRAWLISAGRFKVIDSLRRRARFDAALEDLARHLESAADEADGKDCESEDDLLRLVFTACHPALSQDAQVAITLREVCGLNTEEIANAFLVPVPTMAQRIVRAKAKIREAGIPFQLPSAQDLAVRLEPVLKTVYLVFNEGYSASAGNSLVRPDLSREAIRLGRLLLEMMPEPEVTGLLALMLLHESRRTARSSSQGELVLLDRQDRSLWDRPMIEEGLNLVERSLRAGRVGPYSVQAAIAALHAEGQAAITDWPQIVGLYDVLLRLDPSPIVELNRAVAVAMRDGPAAGCLLVDGILARGELLDYYLAHSTRGELCRRMGLPAAALESYRRALGLVKQEALRRQFEKVVEEIQGSIDPNLFCRDLSKNRQPKEQP